MSQFVAACAARRNRAVQLADEYDSAEEVLKFYASMAEFQASITSQTAEYRNLALLNDEVAEFVLSHAPEALQSAAAPGLHTEAFAKAIDDYWYRHDTTSKASFFARVVLQVWAGTSAEVKPIASGENFCPDCGHPPQVAALRKQGHGQAIDLVCSLCFQRWKFRRVCCPGCLESDSAKIEFHAAEDFPNRMIQICRSCKSFLQLVDTEKVPQAVPFVDELAAPVLDLWARQKGYAKEQPNFAGL